MNTELQTQRDTSQMTPIEIALQTDENGWISSKRLYEFLGLDTTNYARWCEVNIVNNPIFRENVDYEVFVIKDEKPQGGRPSTEYMVTKDVAKHLAINSRSERGAEVRKYYLKVEDQTAQAIIKLQTIQNQLVARVEQLGLKVQQSEERCVFLENKTGYIYRPASEWRQYIYGLFDEYIAIKQQSPAPGIRAMYATREDMMGLIDNLVNENMSSELPLAKSLFKGRYHCEWDDILDLAEQTTDLRRYCEYVLDLGIHPEKHRETVDFCQTMGLRPTSRIWKEENE